MSNCFLLNCWTLEIKDHLNLVEKLMKSIEWILIKGIFVLRCDQLI